MRHDDKEVYIGIAGGNPVRIRPEDDHPLRPKPPLDRFAKPDDLLEINHAQTCRPLVGFPTSPLCGLQVSIPAASPWARRPCNASRLNRCHYFAATGRAGSWFARISVSRMSFAIHVFNSSIPATNALFSLPIEKFEAKFLAVEVTRKPDEMRLDGSRILAERRIGSDADGSRPKMTVHFASPCVHAVRRDELIVALHVGRGNTQLTASGGAGYDDSFKFVRPSKA